MKTVMRFTARVCFTASSLLLLSVVAYPQNVSKEFCRQIKSSVIKKLNPTGIRIQDNYDNECVFEFSVDGADVNLDVEKLNTAKASHESVDRFLELLAVGQGLEGRTQLHFASLDTNDNWDETYFITATTTNSAVLVLRKGRVRITILSAKEELLTRVERLLRDNADLK